MAAEVVGDRSRFKAATLSIALNRTIIAADFGKFKTAWFRRHYVGWLKNLPVGPHGDWPNGRPYLRNDNASTLLAQIDERWLGLDG